MKKSKRALSVYTLQNKYTVIRRLLALYGFASWLFWRLLNCSWTN